MTRLWKVSKTLFVIAFVVLIVGALGVGIGYKVYVLDEPGEHLDKENIQALIAQESPVLYSDGETAIGVFFADEHRIYVEYQDIPQCWVDAITSAEDQRFFEHSGVDWMGFGRAMTQNIKAGRVVSGGSTLTMQTSENLFHPGTRDVHGKMYEVLDSYRLEAHYEKTDILEFYANQFHVHGNGRGLGIAARYFFDKDIHQEELTLQECAFLAGMVKGPGNYNPFLAQTPEARDAKKTRALKRANYVLERMHVDGKISRISSTRISMPRCSSPRVPSATIPRFSWTRSRGNWSWLRSQRFLLPRASRTRRPVVCRWSPHFTSLPSAARLMGSGTT